MPCPSCGRAGLDTLCVPCGPHGGFLTGVLIWSQQMQSRISNLRVRTSLLLHPDPILRQEPRRKPEMITLDDLEL